LCNLPRLDYGASPCDDATTSVVGKLRRLFEAALVVFDTRACSEARMYKHVLAIGGEPAVCSKSNAENKEALQGWTSLWDGRVGGSEDPTVSHAGFYGCHVRARLQDRLSTLGCWFVIGMRMRWLQTLRHSWPRVCSSCDTLLSRRTIQRPLTRRNCIYANEACLKPAWKRTRSSLMSSSLLAERVGTLGQLVG
jgi:hypothetical protein